MASLKTMRTTDGSGASVPRVLHLLKDATQLDLATAIEREGYRYVQLTDIDSACQIVMDNPPDIILVEQFSLSLGAAKLEHARQERGPIPLIVVGRGEESDELVALALGADDYVPYGSINRLVARIKAALRRTRNQSGTRQLCEAGPLSLDESRHQAHVEGRAVCLTPSEFRLLHEIVAANGHVVHRDYLLSRVFGVNGDIESRRIDVHVAGLRKKLGPAADWLQTVRTIGYVWREPIASGSRASIP